MAADVNTRRSWVVRAHVTSIMCDYGCNKMISLFDLARAAVSSRQSVHLEGVCCISSSKPATRWGRSVGDSSTRKHSNDLGLGEISNSMSISFFAVSSGPITVENDSGRLCNPILENSRLASIDLFIRVYANRNRRQDSQRRLLEQTTFATENSGADERKCQQSRKQTIQIIQAMAS